VPGYYNRDHQAFIDYRNASQTAEGFTSWQRHWVDPVRTPQDYMRLIGRERMQSLRLKHHLYSEAVDYGY
jgi:glutaconate CoA-transferase subunit A